MPNYKLFVIEDNRTEGMLLHLALSGIDELEVRIFPSANEMLGHLDEQPDICVVDLNLPDMPGMELIRRVKEYDPQIHLVVVSAQRDVDVIAEAQAEGIYNYLVKSEVCLTYLHRVVNDLLVLIKHQPA
ncbi:MAG: response regulator [Bernardetiaceae bacterium]|jgi:DNA-binding NtrC family response regulator|nr:response regulator [Bernardetiaceae bacterium]